MKLAGASRALLVFAVLNACAAFPAGLLLLRNGQAALAVSIFLLGLSLGPCLAAYPLVSKKRKTAARRVVLVAGGLSIIAFSVLSGANLDLEGFFLFLFSGIMGAPIGHTLVTLIVGPLLFGRILCGWGCWRAMILELLPIGRSPGRHSGLWRVLPFAGLAVCVGVAALLAFRRHDPSSGAFVMLGFAAYYAASVGLAFALRDQRAFCKYLCPSGLVLGFTSRLSVVKMASDKQLCNGCGACSRICPMDIDVARFAKDGRRIASGQCILCRSCAEVCPTGALHPSAGFDIAGNTPFFRQR